MASAERQVGLLARRDRDGARGNHVVRVTLELPLRCGDGTNFDVGAQPVQTILVQADVALCGDDAGEDRLDQGGGGQPVRTVLWVEFSSWETWGTRLGTTC